MSLDLYRNTKRTGKQVKNTVENVLGSSKKVSKPFLSIFLVLSLSVSLSGCGKAAEGADMAKAACQAWQTAWSNALSENIGDARSQYSDFDTAYEIAKVAAEANEEWQPMADAIGFYMIYAASDFDDSLFPDSTEQVAGMDLCEQFDIDVMG
jgi:hypothetical protein